MSTGDLIAADRQLELQGILMGEGTRYQLESWDMFALPNLSTQDTDRNDVGVMPGADRYQGRLLTIDLWLDAAPDLSLANEDRAALETAFAPSSATTELHFRIEQERFCYFGRGRGISTGMPSLEVWPVECRFLATDPRIYSGQEHVESLGASTTLENAGTRSTFWQWTVVGPCTGPRLRRLDDPAAYTFDFPGMTLGDGQVLVVDGYYGTALRTGVSVIGQARAADGVRLPFPFAMPPGQSDWSFDSDSGSPTSTLTYRDAWA